jgi:hypothetical protein
MTQTAFKAPQKPAAEPKKSNAATPAKSARNPSHEEISNRARALWEARGRPSGRDEEIWLTAEAELRSGVA